MIHIKCPQCGEFSTDENICLSCGAALKSEKTHKKTIEKQQRKTLLLFGADLIEFSPCKKSP